MKHKQLLLLLAMAGAVFSLQATSIETLIKTSKISAVFKAKGGHTGNCMVAELHNLSSDTQYVLIEAGRRLSADTTADQDIFIVKEAFLVMAPYQYKKTDIFGFCCESHDHSPDKGHTFTVGKMAPEPWVKLAKYINQHAAKLGLYTIQSAVWVMSDNHSLSGISATDAESDDLTRFVAQLTGKTIPWYKTSYKQVPGRVHSGEAAAVTGEISFQMRAASVVSVHVVNSRGMTVAVLEEDKGYMTGTHTYQLNINTGRLPKGKYKILVLEDGSNRIAEQDFEI